ncbi:hypothetical protein CR513_00707, partial [Mucuna pruriens]
IISASPPLNGDNYYNWSRVMEKALYSNNKTRFIIGNLPQSTKHRHVKDAKTWLYHRSLTLFLPKFHIAPFVLEHMTMRRGSYCSDPIFYQKRKPQKTSTNVQLQAHSCSPKSHATRPSNFKHACAHSKIAQHGRAISSTLMLSLELSIDLDTDEFKGVSARLGLKHFLRFRTGASWELGSGFGLESVS